MPGTAEELKMRLVSNDSVGMVPSQYIYIVRTAPGASSQITSQQIFSTNNLVTKAGAGDNEERKKSNRSSLQNVVEGQGIS